MRRLIYVIAALQVLFLLALIGETMLNPSDAAGQGMAYGFLTIGGVALAVFLIPAVLLARSPKWSRLGLILVLVPPAALVILKVM